MTIPRAARWFGAVLAAMIMTGTMLVAPAGAATILVSNPGTLHPADLDLVQVQMSATGGIPPYTWSISGNTFGLHINPTTGLISGIVHPGTYNVTATATDTANATGSTFFTFTVQRSCHTC